MSSEPWTALIPREILYNDMNVLRTASLFKETCRLNDNPIISLKSTRRDDMISLRDLYIQFCVDDPSETEFAEHVFGDVGVWEQIKKANWITPYLEEYRLVTDTKRKAKAFRYLAQEVKEQGKNAYGAAKYLIEEPWKDKRNTETRKKSRKTTQAAAEEVKQENPSIADDWARIQSSMN